MIQFKEKFIPVNADPIANLILVIFYDNSSKYIEVYKYVNITILI